MNVRRTVALLSVTASLAAPAASVAKPIGGGDSSSYSGTMGPTISAPAPNSSDDNTLSIVLASSALAIAVGGAVYSSRLTLSQRRTAKAG